MSIYDNVAYGPRTHGIRSKVKLDELVEESLRGAAIWDEVKDRLKKSALGLSGGQQQRVAIARALCTSQPLILFDEPTSALDVSVRAQILNLLTDLKKELGLAMVFISHDIQTVRYISDDIIVMNGGKIVEQGEAKQVFQHPQDPYTKMLLGAAPSLLHPKLGE